MPPSSHSLSAVRAADLLVLRFELYNLAPAADGLRREDPAAPAFVVAHFPSQHLLEEAFLELGPERLGGPLRARLAKGAGVAPVVLAGSFGAAPSRVAFVVPDEVEVVPATLDELLAFLATCPLNVVGTASGPVAHRTVRFPGWWPFPVGRGGRGRLGEGEEERRPRLVPPGEEETAIELPYRLLLSPPAEAGFAHFSQPRALGLDRVELWHSRLGLRPGEEIKPHEQARPTVRAVWVRIVKSRWPLWNPANAFAVPPKPPDPPAFEPPFISSLSERDRHQIAHRSSNYWQRIETAPIEVERLALSALGGWLDASGRWQPLSGLPLEEWTHRAVQGRDHFVKVVEAGHLYPFGHRASLVKITERKWQDGVPGRPAALRQRHFVVVRVPELRYREGAEDRFGRLMPLKRVRLRTLVTPPIEPKGAPSFRIEAEGKPFRFAVEGEDQARNVTQFSMPLVFVALGEAASATGAAEASAALKGTGGDGRRTDLGGTPIAFVPADKADLGATTFPLAAATFDATPGGPLEAGFHPQLLKATAALPAVEMVSGQGATKEIEYAQPYKDHGFGPDNAGELFAALSSPHGLELGKAADRAGGLLSPSLSIGGLSRLVGPVGGELGPIAAGNFDPAKFFPLDGAYLFGILKLGEVLKLGDLAAEAPKLVTKALDGAPLAAEWKFTPKLKPLPAGPLPLFDPEPDGRLELWAQIEAKGPSPNAKVSCTLERVALAMPAGEARCVELPLKRFHFEAVAGRKPRFDVEIEPLQFVGPLSFVNTLRELIPLDGFSDPPAVEVTPEGISAGFSIALPDIAVGMFALQHTSLGARLELPFVGPPPTFAFNFCSRAEPFLLTVSAFGGGGFVLLKVDPRGVQRLEAALEFGASVSMDFVVASGGVHVMAGVYLVVDAEDGAALTGYFRAGGNVSVLGIVSVSIELYLGLTYKQGKAIGRATLTVEVELFLFSASVEISCERKLAGSSGDPPLELMLAPYPDPDDSSASPRMIDPWAEYWAAYA